MPKLHRLASLTCTQILLYNNAKLLNTSLLVIEESLLKLTLDI